jgi:hypothetical protein
MKWPARSPDLTQCNLFLWGYLQEKVFVPPLPLDADELKLRIIAATEITDWNMLEYEMIGYLSGDEWTVYSYV